MGQISRTLWLDVAKGIGILLVILGHLVAREAPASNAWWDHVKAVIYSFHMPFFLIVSGFTCCAFTKDMRTLPDYGKYAWKRFDRLMIPYIIFALAIYFGKYFASNIAHVDNGIGNSSRPWDVLTDPMDNYSIFLWYVYLLFLFSLVTPFLRKLPNLALWAVTGVGFLAFITYREGYWAPKGLGRAIVQYVPYLLLGGVFSRSHTYWHLAKWGWLGIIPFSYLAVKLCQANAIVPWTIPFAMAFSGSALFLWICFQLEKSATWSGRLAWIGGFAFPIYLMNTMLIGVAKAVLMKVMPWDGWQFFVFLPCLLGAGLFLPILLQVYVVEKLPILRRLLKR